MEMKSLQSERRRPKHLSMKQMSPDFSGPPVPGTLWVYHHFLTWGHYQNKYRLQIFPATTQTTIRNWHMFNPSLLYPKLKKIKILAADTCMQIDEFWGNIKTTLAVSASPTLQGLNTVIYSRRTLKICFTYPLLLLAPPLHTTSFPKKPLFGALSNGHPLTLSHTMQKRCHIEDPEVTSLRFYIRFIVLAWWRHYGKTYVESWTRHCWVLYATSLWYIQNEAWISRRNVIPIYPSAHVVNTTLVLGIARLHVSAKSFLRPLSHWARRSGGGMAAQFLVMFCIDHYWVYRLPSYIWSNDIHYKVSITRFYKVLYLKQKEVREDLKQHIDFYIWAEDIFLTWKYKAYRRFCMASPISYTGIRYP